MNFSLKLLVCLLLSCGFSQMASADAFSKYKSHEKYDKYFKKYSKHYFGVGFDWKIFKAQAIAESNLRHNVKSPVGAQGLMQIMPRTYSEIQRKNKLIKGNATEPKFNIAAGIFYDKQLWKFWTTERDFAERLKFMFASYNAGAGNILKAQKKSKAKGNEVILWQPVADSLNEVTGKHSTETVQYVEKIFIIHEDIN